MKDVVITGAGSGIGQHIACALAGQGWRVFAMDRSEDSLNATWSLLAGEASDRFRLLRCDVANSADVKRAFEEVRSQTEGLDALICSAGILRPGFLSDMSEDDFDALFDVNTKGTWLCARAAVPLLAKRAGGGAPTRMVLVGSMAALRPKVKGGAYAASKIAVSYLGRVLAVELGPRNILVNIIAPSTVDTPMTQALQSLPGYKLSGPSPLGRVATPEDVTGVVEFLLSPAANYVSGAVVPIDGAMSAAFVP